MLNKNRSIRCWGAAFAGAGIGALLAIRIERRANQEVTIPWVVGGLVLGAIAGFILTLRE
jgi:hypothetical protein